MILMSSFFRDTQCPLVPFSIESLKSCEGQGCVRQRKDGDQEGGVVDVKDHCGYHGSEKPTPIGKTCRILLAYS